MANPIPPLLCSTPPPIDFDEESSANIDAIDDFCEFDTGDTEIFDRQSLPSTPRHITHSTNKNLDSPGDEINVTDEIEKENIDCNNKTVATEPETFNVEEVNTTEIEKHKSEDVSKVPISDVLNEFEENSHVEKLFSETLTLCADYDINNDKENNTKNIDTEEMLDFLTAGSSLSDKNEKYISDDKNVDENGKEDSFLSDKVFEFSNIEKNELSASENETLQSSIENSNNILASNSETVSNSKNMKTESLSLTINEHENVSNTTNSTIKNNKDEVITSRADEILESSIESKFSEATNVNEDQCNFTFEADFSQFQAFDSLETTNINQINSVPIDNTNIVELKQEELSTESFDDDDFDNFQNYSNQSINFPNNNDSNGFTDFKEAAPPPLSENSTSSDSLSNLNSNIKTILDTMFPLSNSDNNSYIDVNIQNSCQKNAIILNSVDSATALNFQWTNSTIKQSLVKSIGIDSRNILHGEKWNSSMPRFAANLGFNPLEPLKPVKLDSTASAAIFLENEPSTSLGKVVTNRTDVPAVEFDWNTSGLVNPLDGIKEVIHERKTEKLHTTQTGELQDTIQQLSKTENIISDLSCTGSSNSKDTRSIVETPDDQESTNAKEYLSTFDANLNIQQSQEPTLIKNNNVNNIKSLEQLAYINYQSSENIDINTTSSTNTFIVPLKETHIFTPSKSDAAVSRSTTNISETTGNGKCIPVDFDYEIAAAGTVIDETVIKKEYRDIEYNPSKFILDTNSIQLNENVNSLNSEKSEIIEEPISNDLCMANEDWDFYNSKFQNDTNEIYDKQIINKNNDANLRKELTINTNEILDTFHNGLPVEKFNNFLKPTIGLSPTENIITQNNELNTENKETTNNQLYKDNYVDDEFTDFQFVPPSSTLVTHTIPIINNASDIKKPQSLSTNNNIKFKDNEKNIRTNTLDQMILSPAILLPQTVQITCAPKIEWPEPGIDPEELARIERLFPSSKQNNFNNQASNSLSHTSNISIKNPSVINNDDDWSDFISVPAVNIAENNLNTIYCPKSPTKVSKSNTITADYNNDDEWSDFISNIPSTSIMNSGQFNNSDTDSVKKKSVTTSYNPSITGNNTSQQSYNMNSPNEKPINTNNDQSIINNKMCQYLLSNGNHESKDRRHLNSLKTTDFLPNHHIYQQQQQQQQQNINRNQLNHHKIAPSISLIPDLGYVAPQNLISIPKSNFQKK